MKISPSFITFSVFLFAVNKDNDKFTANGLFWFDKWIIFCVYKGLNLQKLLRPATFWKVSLGKTSLLNRNLCCKDHSSLLFEILALCSHAM